MKRKSDHPLFLDYSYSISTWWVLTILSTSVNCIKTGLKYRPPMLVTSHVRGQAQKLLCSILTYISNSRRKITYFDSFLCFRHEGSIKCNMQVYARIWCNKQDYVINVLPEVMHTNTASQFIVCTNMTQTIYGAQTILCVRYIVVVNSQVQSEPYDWISLWQIVHSGSKNERFLYNCHMLWLLDFNLALSWNQQQSEDVGLLVEWFEELT